RDLTHTSPQHRTRPQPHSKRHRRPNQHIPSPRHARYRHSRIQHPPRKLPQRHIHRKPRHHPHNRSPLRSVLRQSPQQKHPQQAPIRHRSDRQPNLHHVPLTARVDRINRHRKQHQSPH